MANYRVNRIPGEEPLFDVEAYDGFGASEEAAPQTKPHQVVNPAQSAAQPAASASASQAPAAPAAQPPIPTRMHSPGAHPKNAVRGFASARGWRIPPAAEQYSDGDHRAGARRAGCAILPRRVRAAF